MTFVINLLAAIGATVIAYFAWCVYGEYAKHRRAKP